jgi:DNA-binding CsgD family transcriptional regulator
MLDKVALVHKISILVNHELKIVYYRSDKDVEKDQSVILGKHPWDFVNEGWKDSVKESFESCVSSQLPKFYLAKMGDKSKKYMNQYMCTWLWPITQINPDCKHPCVVIKCESVLVPPNIEKLSSKERKILEMVGIGHCTKNIAKKLEICTTTVYTHLLRIKKKLELEDRLQVAVWATLHREIITLEKHKFQKIEKLKVV